MTDGFYKTREWRTLRYQCLQRDRWHCVICNASVRLKGASRVDHIQPRRQCPALALVLSNLRTLCSSCDNKRHAEKGGHPRTPVGVDGFPARWR